MNHIVLTREQSRIVLQAAEPVELLDEQGSLVGEFALPPIEVRDEQGRTVAHLTPLQPEEIEAIVQAKRSRATGGPRVPSDQVQEHLQRLSAIREKEGLDEAKMLERLKRMRAGE